MAHETFGDETGVSFERVIRISSVSSERINIGREFDSRCMPMERRQPAAIRVSK
jgi:hypothetical protein